MPAGIVYDLGGKYDQSFNEIASYGVNTLGDDLDMEIRELELQSEAQREQAFRRFAEAVGSPVIGVGEAARDAIVAVAPDYPDVSFVILGATLADPAAAPNVRAVSYDAYEMGYLAGVLSATASASGTVGFIGGMDIPLTRTYADGYEAGALSVHGNATVLVLMTGTTPSAWNDPVRGAELARTLIGQGADVFFSPAGGTALGVYQAVDDAGLSSVGLDLVDSLVFGASMITSIYPRWDMAVVDAVISEDGAAPGNVTLGIEQGFFGYIETPLLDGRLRSVLDAALAEAPVQPEEPPEPLDPIDSGDRIEGTGGDDVLDGTDGDDGILGQGGDDLIRAGSGNDNVAGSDGDDTAFGEDGNDFIGGGQGDDRLSGDAGNDTLGGGFGEDDMTGGEGNDVLAGGPDDDLLDGGAGDDTMGASFGDDTVLGGTGDDSLGGGAGRDSLSGDAGSDSIGGGEGDDTVNGGAGNDFLAGGGRADQIVGGPGNDTINGGEGSDRMSGGNGADIFVFNEPDPRVVDVIVGFEGGVDKLRLSEVENAPGSGLQGRLDALDITDAVVDGTPGVALNYEGQTIRISGVSASDLTLDDFEFI
ncbi:basic membrane lipoprotein [Roseivivax marinus]|uniref:Basic membrane lipoprotein n=1 Tax=Roseivivax marinus TaxID=1379903 RepID=W4HGS2_9RHOB|nr:BMP family ABC transporter substrate-binding protein [Roseivivax marinus]ETW11603.1 basic membrane lipoprotein [Roseivivax marinus]